jgi:hypothetical protein
MWSKTGVGQALRAGWFVVGVQLYGRAVEAFRLVWQSQCSGAYFAASGLLWTLCRRVCLALLIGSLLFTFTRGSCMVNQEREIRGGSKFSNHARKQPLRASATTIPGGRQTTRILGQKRSDRTRVGVHVRPNATSAQTGKRHQPHKKKRQFRSTLSPKQPHSIEL